MQHLHHDLTYSSLLEDILREGVSKGDRTGTGALSTFGRVSYFDLSGGKIPLLTTKQMFYRSFIHETLWFLSGSTNIRYLKEQGISIWDSWVIPGTEEYRPMTDEEVRTALRARHLPNGQPGDGIRAVEFGEMELLQEESQEEIYTTTFDDESETLTYYFWTNGYRRAYEYITGEPAHVLCGGSIGPGAYGAMWRRIEDTRIVSPVEYHSQQYPQKGFKLIGPLPNGDAVVTRTIDQIANAINLLRTNPDNRRIIVHAFDNRQVDFCALPPCHSWFQFWSRELSTEERSQVAIERGLPVEVTDSWEEGELDVFLDHANIPKRALKLMIVCRSQDYPVGTPFNQAQYALLAHMVAQVTGHVAEELIWVGGDVHVYKNQIELVQEQLERNPHLDVLPRVVLNSDIKEIDDFTFDDIQIVDYDKYHPAIRYAVAV
jgi:thymidylate synthase